MTRRSLSVVIDSIEDMFEHREVSTSTIAREPAASLDRVRQLQDRISKMQTKKLDEKVIPTHPALAPLLPGGGLKQGSTYSIERSATLIMALLAAPSAAGSWCAVVGVPEFGLEAASRFGINLDRLVLVPRPGEHWLNVTAAVADVMGVVVTRPPKRATDSTVQRLSARLRQRGATMLVLGSWPSSEAMLSLSASRWHGIGAGYGHLSAREVTVTVSSRSAARPRSARLWFPDAGEQFRAHQSSTSGPAEMEVAPRREATG